jgi:hypothetical protein
MSAISYSILVGGTLQSIVVAANAPAAGSIELRMDTTATSITDAAYPGGVRAVKRGEIQALIRVLEEYLVVDSNLFQG